MSAHMRLTQLRLILALAGNAPWRWELFDTPSGVWRQLVVDGDASPTHVFAAGEVLSAQARAIALLNPAVLDEMSQADWCSVGALETLESCERDLRRLLRRIYRLRQHDHYRDVRAALTSLMQAMALLRRTELASDQALDDWLRIEADPPPEDGET